MFEVNGSTSTANCTDGTSSTVAVAETIRNVWNGVPPTWGHAGHVQVGIAPDMPWNTGITVWQPDPVLWTSNPAANKIGRLVNWASAGSLHSNGCHFLMGDGAVRYVNQNISDLTLSNICRMADGQTASEF